jgi:phage terminase large subunit-like protein
MSSPPITGFASLPEADREAFLASLSEAEKQALLYDWPSWARPDQLPPPGDWRVWTLLGGRGSGKTRSGCEWLRAHVEAGRHAQVAVLGPTMDSVRRILVEGPSGILAVAPPWARPSYEPANHRIIWPNGAVAWTFSSQEPDRLRGPNISLALVDEFTSCENIELRGDADLRSGAGRTGDPGSLLLSKLWRTTAFCANLRHHRSLSSSVATGAVSPRRPRC